MKTMLLCRATGTHAWSLVPPIIVLGTARRVVLHCERCDSWRIDVWGKAGQIDGRSYQRHQTYQTYLKDHSRDGARLDVIGSGAKETTDANNHPHLRLLHGGKKEQTTRIRRRNTRAAKRKATA